jgi:hypothetical protein
MLSGRGAMPEDENALDAITVTFFNDIKGRHKTERTISWTELRKEILDTSADSKNDLPLLKLARFGDVRSLKGSLRNDLNLAEITGIEADYDGEAIPPADAIEILKTAGIKAIIYTTPSHTADKPRWRVLCPTSGPLSPGRRFNLVARLNGAFGGVLADESFTLSQAYYYGRIRNKNSFSMEVVDGRPIDTCDELEYGLVGKSESSPRVHCSTCGIVDFQEADRVKFAELIVSGLKYHQASVRLIGGMARDGVPIAQTKGRLFALYDAVDESRRDKRWSDRRADVPAVSMTSTEKKSRRGPKSRVAKDPHPPALVHPRLQISPRSSMCPVTSARSSTKLKPPCLRPMQMCISAARCWSGLAMLGSRFAMGDRCSHIRSWRSKITLWSSS